MSAMTSEELSRFFREGPVDGMRIAGIVETDDSRYLGAVGLMRAQPLYRSISGFPMNGYISDSSRFYLWPSSEAKEGKAGLVAVFRNFDSSKYQDHPDDLLAGWVPPEDAAKLESWVADMNEQLRGLLELKRRQEEKS
jgi:hypothetical protein